MIYKWFIKYVAQNYDILSPATLSFILTGRIGREKERLWKIRECEKPLMRDREWRNTITKSKGKGS